MKGIGLFVDTDSVKNKVMDFGPIVMMAKSQFIRIRGKMAKEIGYAEDEGKETFLHVVYNGPAQVCRNPTDWKHWNTVLVPLKDQKMGSLEAMMKEFFGFAVAYIFTAFNCDRDQHFEKVESLK